MARLLETTFLNGPAGRLEALHEGPEEGVKIERAAVVCHPHPLFGGTLHNKVAFRLARGIRATGAAVLRFNFRGVGQSGGEHDHGKGEQDDVRTAVAYMRDRYPGLPLVLAGFSFGSSMSLKVACTDPGVERVIGCGVPVDRASFGFCARAVVRATSSIRRMTSTARGSAWKRCSPRCRSRRSSNGSRRKTTSSRARWTCLRKR
ncbi:MAG: alpha/beta fold hydrolase [Bryobacterales bacterium]